MTPPRQRTHPRVRFALRRGLFVVAACLLLSWLVAAVIALTIDPRRGLALTRETWHSPATLSSIQLWQSPLAVYAESTWRFGLKRAWGPEQAAGPPDTPRPGDFQTAWAPATQDGQREWLSLRWHTPILAARILIHQSHNPGAIDSITVGDERAPIWTAASLPLDAPANPLEIPLAQPRRIASLTLHLNSPAIAGWNEIDAVGLLDPAGLILYAESADASSTYADRSNSTVLPLPSWCRIDSPSQAMQNGELVTEVLACGAFGWPLPAWVACRTLDARPAPSGRLPVASATIAAVPFRPIPIAVAINTLTYAAALGILSVTFLRPLRTVRRLLRMQRGHCPDCGYDLRFNFTCGCSECGFLKQHHAPSPSSPATPN